MALRALSLAVEPSSGSGTHVESKIISPHMARIDALNVPTVICNSNTRAFDRHIWSIAIQKWLSTSDSSYGAFGH